MLTGRFAAFGGAWEPGCSRGARRRHGLAARAARSAGVRIATDCARGRIARPPNSQITVAVPGLPDHARGRAITSEKRSGVRSRGARPQPRIPSPLSLPDHPSTGRRRRGHAGARRSAAPARPTKRSVEPVVAARWGDGDHNVESKHLSEGVSAERRAQRPFLPGPHRSCLRSRRYGRPLHRELSQTRHERVLFGHRLRS